MLFWNKNEKVNYYRSRLEAQILETLDLNDENIALKKEIKELKNEILRLSHEIDKLSDKCDMVAPLTIYSIKYHEIDKLSDKCEASDG